MSIKAINIIIVETSEIIYEGINIILTNSGRSFNIMMANNLHDIEQINIRVKTDIILINPLLIQNQIKEFLNLKKDLGDVSCIGLVYTYFDQQILSIFDDIVYINDSAGKIISSIQKLITSKKTEPRHQHQETLSERESDVLKLLVAGNPNKVIADKLNISAHTVISHRKKISQKTGIKSVAGLTIYAVVNNILSIDDYRV